MFIFMLKIVIFNSFISKAQQSKSEYYLQSTFPIHLFFMSSKKKFPRIVAKRQIMNQFHSIFFHWFWPFAHTGLLNHAKWKIITFSLLNKKMTRIIMSAVNVEFLHSEWAEFFSQCHLPLTISNFYIQFDRISRFHANPISWKCSLHCSHDLIVSLEIDIPSQNLSQIPSKIPSKISSQIPSQIQSIFNSRQQYEYGTFVDWC